MGATGTDQFVVVWTSANQDGDLDGVFGHLPNVAWTDLGPVAPADLDAVRLTLRREGRTLTIRALDKFPPMTDYVVPPGVRLADASRVLQGKEIHA